MAFTSPIFLFLFLPISVFLYYVFPQRFRALLLLLYSILFYIWGQGNYVLVLLLVVFLNYLLGLGIRTYRKPLLIIGIVLNVGILAVFKYFNFSVGNINAIFGLHINPASWQVPLGISFMTFMAIAYLVDVYRGNAVPSMNPFNLAFYLSFFPKITSGPLDRYNGIVEQLPDRKADMERIANGIKRFIIGLGKKVLIADILAPMVNQIFSVPIGDLPTETAWLGIIAFTLQLYFDFSGYTDMAIGIGRIFGFELMANFNYPYVSASIREFWRRWHLTLSSWLRDYLYIPLGGNRGTTLRTVFNLMIVFLVCGIWHGASWTFVAWGLWHGLFMALERIKILRFKVISPLRHIYALLVIMIGWVFFRAESITYALGYLKSMFVSGQVNPAYDYSVYLNLVVVIAMIAGIIGSMPVIPLLSRFAGKWRIASVTSVAWLLGIFALSILEIASGFYHPFIYGNY